MLTTPVGRQSSPMRRSPEVVEGLDQICRWIYFGRSFLHAGIRFSLVFGAHPPRLLRRAAEDRFGAPSIGSLFTTKVS